MGVAFNWTINNTVQESDVNTKFMKHYIDVFSSSFPIITLMNY